VFIYIWKKIFKKGSIDIFPSGTIEVGYSMFGPTVSLNGTFRGVNQGFFINSLSIQITKTKDKATSTHLFDWGLFKAQKLTLKGEEIEAELPYGIMLMENQPKRYNILFCDINTKEAMQKILRPLKEEWNKVIFEDLKSAGNLKDKEEIISNKYYKEFNESKIHVDSYTALDRLFYWEPGEYLLIMKVNTSRPNRTFERQWKFSLKEDEVQTMRLNVIKMMHDALFIPSFGQYNFAYARHEEV
jgi:hypothetical protein